MVTDEALIAETAIWPNFFLMNVFFALKGSKLFIIIPYQQDLCKYKTKEGLLGQRKNVIKVYVLKSYFIEETYFFKILKKVMNHD